MMFLQKPMLGTQLDRSDSLNNPVLDLLFNEGHGDRVNDLSGWGNHGTLHGFDFPPTAVSGWNPGADGVALAFDSGDDVIRVPNSPSLNPTAITIDFVVNPRTGYGGDSPRLIDKDEPYGGYLMYVAPDTGYLNWTVRDVSGVSTQLTGNITLPTNICTRVIATYGEGSMAIYQNAVLDASVSTDTVLAAGDIDCYIGNRSVKDRGFGGSIARARILPRAMSAFEVMQTQIDPYGVYLQ